MLTEKTKAEIFLTCLDRILAGEKDIGPVEDTEVAELLRLAQNMIAADINMSSKKKASLRKLLLEHISQANLYVLPGTLQAEQGSELTEEELEYAAAGLQVRYDVNICPRCGIGFDRRQSRCLVCGYYTL